MIICIIYWKIRNKEFEKSLVFDKDNETALYFVNMFNNIIAPIYNAYKEKKKK